MKKTTKRLKLDAATVRNLSAEALAQAIGGASFTCDPTTEGLCPWTRLTRCLWVC